MSSVSRRNTRQTKLLPRATQVASASTSPSKDSPRAQDAGIVAVPYEEARVLLPTPAGWQPLVEQAIKKEPGSEDTEHQAKPATPVGNNLTGDGASANGSGSQNAADEAALSTSVNEEGDAAELDAMDNEALFGSSTDEGSQSLDEDDLFSGFSEEEKAGGGKPKSKVKAGGKRKKGEKLVRWDRGPRRPKTSRRCPPQLVNNAARRRQVSRQMLLLLGSNGQQ